MLFVEVAKAVNVVEVAVCLRLVEVDDCLHFVDVANNVEVVFVYFRCKSEVPGLDLSQVSSSPRTKASIRSRFASSSTFNEKQI